MNINPESRLNSFFLARIQHYNHKKYWRLREIVIDPANKRSKIYKLMALMYIKRCDAYNLASMGTDLGNGARFESVPHFPHGIKGIIIHPSVKVGKNSVIYQFVTIGKKNDEDSFPVLGDNVTVSAGAKILGGVKIGNNVVVGANAVVISDIPDNCIAVGVPAVAKKIKL